MAKSMSESILLGFTAFTEYSDSIICATSSDVAEKY